LKFVLFGLINSDPLDRTDLDGSVSFLEPTTLPAIKQFLEVEEKNPFKVLDKEWTAFT